MIYHKACMGHSVQDTYLSKAVTRSYLDAWKSKNMRWNMVWTKK